MTTMLGLPSGARIGSGHHGVDSAKVSPTTPPNSRLNSLMCETYAATEKGRRPEGRRPFLTIVNSRSYDSV